MKTASEYLGQITSFINSIGIECRAGRAQGNTFLPGIHIENGCIIYDPEYLKYPGDLLHEAGHLAVMLPEARQTAGGEQMNADLSAPAAEMAAIAWSWATSHHLGLPPHILFHEEGYKGGSESLIANFTAGKYVGVPMLAWLGMTNERKPHSREAVQYPNLKHWLRQ